MIQAIKTYLEEAEPENVKLYFVERSKNQKTKEIKYKTLKTTITSEIGADLIDAGHRQIESKLNSQPEYMEYGIVLSSDRVCVETINKDDVPYLSQLIIQVSNPNLEVFSDDKTNKIFGYIIKIENANKTLFLFRKHTPRKLLEKGKIAMILREGGVFEKLSQVMTIDEVYDAAIVLGEGIEPQVFIFNVSKFESIFSFVEFYEKEIEDKKEEIAGKDVLDDVDTFINSCKGDAKKIKKLARIFKSEEFALMNKAKIKAIVDEYDLNLAFDGSGKIVVNKDNIWTILSILDDDHVHSKATDTKYVARSKVKKSAA
jgi:hypothetical protein